MAISNLLILEVLLIAVSFSMSLLQSQSNHLLVKDFQACGALTASSMVYYSKTTENQKLKKRRILKAARVGKT